MDVWPTCIALAAALIGFAILLRKVRLQLRRRAFRKLRPSPTLEAMILDRARKTAARAPHSLMALSVVTPHRDLGPILIGKYPDGTATRAEHLQFEIGSVTKVITALALARQCVADRLKLEASLGSLVPTWFPSESPWAAVTLEQLATHTSGLPRLPRGFLTARGHREDPYRDFDRRDLEGAMAHTAPRPRSRPHYRYSNFGYGVLGEVCATRAGQGFKELTRQTVLAPMGLNETDYLSDAEPPLGLVPGLRKDGRIVPGWHFDAFAGAGGLVSSLHDLTHLVRVHLQPDSTWRAPADLCLQIHHTINAGRRIGLGWHCTEDAISGTDIWWHNGATAGYRAFVGMVPTAGVGIVLLSNTSPFDWWNGNLDRTGVTVLRYTLKLR